MTGIPPVEAFTRRPRRWLQAGVAVAVAAVLVAAGVVVARSGADPTSGARGRRPADRRQ
jgi:hypothetical protein